MILKAIEYQNIIFDFSTRLLIDFQIVLEIFKENKI